MKKAIKISCLFICLFILFLGAYAYKLSQEKEDGALKAEEVVFKNDCFLLARDQGPEFSIYSIYFNDSISARDTLSSIKQVVEYGALAEKDKPYFIRFGTEDTEKLNHLFWECLNKGGRLSQTEIEDNVKTRGRYKDFLRKRLGEIGCVLSDSVILATPEMCYILGYSDDPCLYGEVYMHFNWRK